MADIKNKLVNLEDLKVLSDYSKEVFATKLQVGGPLTANIASAMTDTDKVYVYTGDESGYTTGGWYYYDGETWVLGGIYQSDGLETDTTLSLAGEAADAAAVGAAIAGVVDNTLSVSGKAADAKSVGDAFLKYNSLNVIEDLPDGETTSRGVTFTWNGSGYTVDGTNTSTSSMSYLFLSGTATTLPRGIEAGKSYLFHCVRSTNSIKFGVLLYRPGVSAYTILLPNDATDMMISIPDDTVGCRICVRVNTGVTVDNGTISDLFVYSAPTNQMLGETADATKARVDDAEFNIGNLLDNNAYDILYGRTWSGPRTNNGITYTWSADGKTVTANGTATSASTCPLGGSSSTIPYGMKIGETYHFSYRKTDNNLRFGAYVYRDGESTLYVLTSGAQTEIDVTLPENTRGLIIEFTVSSGNTVTNAQATGMSIRNARTNEELDLMLSGVSGDVETLKTETANMVSHGVRSLSTTEVNAVTASEFPFGKYFSAAGDKIVSIFGSTGFNFNVSESASYFVLSYETRNSSWVVKGIVDVIRSNGSEHYHGYKVVNAQNVESWYWYDHSWTNIEQIESDVNTLMDEEDKPVYEYYGQFDEIEGWFNYAGNINSDTLGEDTPYYHTNLMKIRGGVTYYSGYMTTSSSVVGCLYDRQKNKIGPILSPVPVFSETKTYAAYTFVKYNGDIYRVKNSHTGPWDDNDFILRTDVTEIFPIYPAYEFNPDVKYAKGRYVHYNDKYWRFTAAHEIGPWTGSDVEEVPYGYIPDQAGNDEPDVGYFPTSGFMISYRYTVPDNAAYISINLANKKPEAAYYRHLSSASIFSENESYAVNSYVVYGHTQNPSIKTDKLYLVKTAHSGPWNSSHFTVQNVSEYFRYRQYVSSKDNYMVNGSANMVIRDTDPLYQRYKNKKLYIIGPSTTAINRMSRTGSYYEENGQEQARFVNPGDTHKEYYERIIALDEAYNDEHGTKIDNRGRAQRGYIAGYQEYIKPYFADVKAIGYSGASMAYGRGANKKVSIYTRVCGGYEKVEWTVSVSNFDPSKDYEAGTYVKYDGDYYRFIKDHEAGPWNPDPDPETGEYEIELVTRQEATVRYREYDLLPKDLSGYDVFYINTDGNGVQGKDYDVDYTSRDKTYYLGALRLICEKIFEANPLAEIYFATRSVHAPAGGTATIFKNHLNRQTRMLQEELSCGLVDFDKYGMRTAYNFQQLVYDGKHSNNDGNQYHANTLKNAILYGAGGMISVDSSLEQIGSAADASVVAHMIQKKVNGTENTPIIITDASNRLVKDMTVYMTLNQSGSGTPSESNIRPFVPYNGMTIIVSPTANAEDGISYTINWADDIGPAYYGTFNPVTGELYRRPYYASYDGQPVSTNWVSDRDKYDPVTKPTPSIGAEVVDIGGTLENVQVDIRAFEPGPIRTLLGENHIWEPSGRRINITYPCDTELYINDRTPMSLRVMQYNCGKFAMGAQNPIGIPDSVFDEKIANYREMFGNVAADIIGVEEYRSYIDQHMSTDEGGSGWDPADHKSTNAELFSPLYKTINSSGGGADETGTPNERAIFSNFKQVGTVDKAAIRLHVASGEIFAEDHPSGNDIELTKHNAMYEGGNYSVTITFYDRQLSTASQTYSLRGLVSQDDPTRVYIGDSRSVVLSGTGTYGWCIWQDIADPDSPIYFTTPGSVVDQHYKIVFDEVARTTMKVVYDADGRRIGVLTTALNSYVGTGQITSRQKELEIALDRMKGYDYAFICLDMNNNGNISPSTGSVVPPGNEPVTSAEECAMLLEYAHSLHPATASEPWTWEFAMGTYHPIQRTYYDSYVDPDYDPEDPDPGHPRGVHGRPAHGPCLDNIIYKSSDRVKFKGFHIVSDFGNDTGWIDIPLKDGVSSYDQYSVPGVCAIGNQVYIRGAVNGNLPNNRIIGQIPAEIMPYLSHIYTAPAYKGNEIVGTATIQIKAKGDETGGNIIVLNSTVTLDSTIRIQLDGTFVTDSLYRRLYSDHLPVYADFELK